MVFKVKEVAKTLLLPILFNMSQLFIFGFFVMFYIFKNPNININDYASSEILLNYINENTLLILFIQCGIFIPIFYLLYKRYSIDKTEFSKMYIVKVIAVSLLLSTSLNFLIIALKHYINIEMVNSPITFTVVLGTGILGPILEEFLFRGIVYARFKNIFKENIAYYLSIFVFAIFHTGGIFQIIFAFVIGYYLTYLYRKFHDIRLSILAHIVVNLTSIFVSPLFLVLF